MTKQVYLCTHIYKPTAKPNGGNKKREQFKSIFTLNYFVRKLMAYWQPGDFERTNNFTRFFL